MELYMKIMHEGKEVFEKEPKKKKKKAGLIIGIIMMILGLGAFFIIQTGFGMPAAAYEEVNVLELCLAYAKDIVSMLSTLTGLIITLVTVLRRKEKNTATVQVSTNT